MAIQVIDEQLARVLGVSVHILVDDGDVQCYEGLPIFDSDPTDVLLKEHVDGDIGPLLLIRRAFLSPNSSDSNMHRNHIFESTCRINGTVYRLSSTRSHVRTLWRHRLLLS